MTGSSCTEKKGGRMAGQAITEFIVVFPVLLLMLCAVVFFARTLVLKQRCVAAVRYVAWYAGRHGGAEPSKDSIRELFFDRDTEFTITHPEPSVGVAGIELGSLGSVLGAAAGIAGTGIEAQGADYPFLRRRVRTGARHFVFMDTWKESGVVGNVLKYGLWAVAAAKGFYGSNSSVDLENPSIPPGR